MSKSNSPAYNAIIQQYKKNLRLNSTIVNLKVSIDEYEIIQKLLKLSIAELILDDVTNTTIDRYMDLCKELFKQYNTQIQDKSDWDSIDHIMEEDQITLENYDFHDEDDDFKFDLPF